jgi:Lhr-like helicase
MKGRNHKLILLRNRKLVERYFYWTEVKRRRFDDVLRILSEEEFFLSEKRILFLINENNDLLNELIENKK